MESIREQTLKIEDMLLSPYAMHCRDTKGRLHPDDECEVRTAYRRDADRIIHSNAFRRLMHKTQVFLAPMGDHYRTRLTHTLEVSQIARVISRALRLNEDLTEAIALGHDLGHTPFGHAGERALDEVYPGGFKHFEQSLRVVDVIEKGGQGLNLTYEVRNGILCHTTGPEADTLEGRVVKLSDKIAYINHDIDDAIRADVLSEADIPSDITAVLGQTKAQRINTLVLSVINCSGEQICVADDVSAAFEKLHKFMFKEVYKNPVCKGEEGKAIDMLKKMYFYFRDNPGKMPAEYMQICEKEGPERAACDYIAGMSDRYALNVFSGIFVPESWA